MRSPISYFGGKGMMAAKIIPLLPPHHTYVEPFCGGASIFFTKEPSPIEVLNDIYSDLVNLFRVLRDRKQFEEFHRLVSLTPYAREEHRLAHDTIKSDPNDPIARAWALFVFARQSFSGLNSTSRLGGWSFTKKVSRKGISKAVSSYLSAIESLPDVHRRLMTAQIEHKDWRWIVKAYDTPETLFYCDPPYVVEAQGEDFWYNHKMTNKDHEDLVNVLLNIEGMCVLSGYKNKLYEPLELAGWKRIEWKTACHAVGKTKVSKVQGEGSGLRNASRTECVWLCPQAQQARDDERHKSSVLSKGDL